MPEPKVRKQAAAKKKRKQHEQNVAARAQKSGESVEDTREALRYESRKTRAEEIRSKREAALAEDSDEDQATSDVESDELEDVTVDDSAEAAESDSDDSDLDDKDSEKKDSKRSDSKSAATSGKDAKSKPAKGKSKANQASADWARKSAPGSRRWVPPTFITIGLLGVAWLVVYYIAGRDIPVMNKIGDWNILVGMGLMALSFVVATLWK